MPNISSSQKSPMNKNPIESELELITENYTYKLLEKYKKKTLGSMDFPRQIIQEFAIFLELPFINITNCSIKSGVFPDAYKISESVPIPKENSLKSLYDLRPISKTPIGGKIIERMMVSELETDTKIHSMTQHKMIILKAVIQHTTL